MTKKRFKDNCIVLNFFNRMNIYRDLTSPFENSEAFNEILYSGMEQK